jgi:hypothetical protein
MRKYFFYVRAIYISEMRKLLKAKSNIIQSFDNYNFQKFKVK